jgi:hypothetical protein
VSKSNNYNTSNKGRVNPYSPQYPAAPQYFANRKEQLDYFSKTVLNTAKLRPPVPSNFIILGDWGMGKTSLLYKLSEIALKELGNKMKAFCFHFTLSPACCKGWDKFCLILLSQLKTNYEASAGLKQKLRSELSKWKIELSLPPVAVKREKKAKVPSLIDSLEFLWKKHLEPSGTDAGFLFLDDVHYFLQVGESDAYFTIRNSFQELVRRECNFSLILTGPKILFAEVTELAEPFTRFFHPFYLEPFDFKGTKDAINKRILANNLKLQVSEDTISAVHEKSRGYPYFVMFIMRELVNMLGIEKRVSLEDFYQCWPSIVSIMEETVFRGRLSKVSDKEKEVLINISKLDESTVSPSMIKGIKGITEFFSRLERKALLIKEERGQYTLFHPLFKDYLRKCVIS